MQTLELLVSLKIPDVTALTAASAIRRRLGYDEVLKELRRSDYYSLDLNATDPLAANGLAQELAEKTNLFVNPNKHSYEVRSPQDRGGGPTPQEGLWRVEVLVTDAEGAEADDIQQALTQRLGYSEQVTSVRRGILWTLLLTADSAEEAREIAEQITVTTARDQGVLVNPHFQAWEII